MVAVIAEAKAEIDMDFWELLFQLLQSLAVSSLVPRWKFSSAHLPRAFIRNDVALVGPFPQA